MSVKLRENQLAESVFTFRSFSSGAKVLGSIDCCKLGNGAWPCTFSILGLSIKFWFSSINRLDNKVSDNIVIENPQVSFSSKSPVFFTPMTWETPAGVSQVMGVKKTGDLLEKLTWGFSITILSLTLLSNLFIEENQNFIESPNIENVQGQAPLPNLQQSIDPNTLAPELNDLNVNTDSANWFSLNFTDIMSIK